jgi:cellulose synthase/poly-beta-1,6-N-acetylglucosamine synthase-like glycosyltransferase
VKILFWLLIGFTFFIYFLYPIVIFFIANLRGYEPGRGDAIPFVSLIIPMHNEEGVVKEKVANILSLDYPGECLEILFVLDGCTDRTRECLMDFKDKRIKIFENNKRDGKVAAINNAIPHAKGNIIVFTDANSLHESDTIRKLARNFNDERVGCVAGKLVYTLADHTVVGRGENLYWKYEDFIKKQESKLGKLLITNGSIQAVRKELYPFPDPEVADDFSIPLLIQAKGYKVIYEPDAIVYEIATQSLIEEFNQKVRIITQGMKGFISLWRQLLHLSPIGIFELLFHKVLRWGVGFYLIVIYISNMALVGNRFYFNFFVLQTIFYTLAFMGLLLRHKIKSKIFYIPFYFCLVNFSSVVALYRFLNGKQTRMWGKAYSTRVRRVSDEG